MKYKIGDKVRIRRDLIAGNEYGGLTYYDNMEREVKGKENIVTIIKTGIDPHDVCWYEFEGCDFSYSEEMIEGLVENKFRAFLREVVCGSLLVKESPYNKIDTHEFDIGMDINEAMRDICSPVRKNLTHEEVEKVIDGVVEFYTEFEPTIVDTVKKMTKTEIEAELGYKIEIVEE